MAHTSFASARQATHARAFTLIELLVTVSVIAVLTSLVFAAVGTVMDSARRLRCLANLRQVTIGVTGYAGDNRGSLPWSYLPWKGMGGSGVGHARGAFEYFISPYLDSVTVPVWEDVTGNKVFACPASPITGSGRQNPGGSLLWRYRSGTYGDNNSYEGALFYLYTNTPISYYNAATADPNIFCRLSYLKLAHFSRPAQVPHQFCSRNYFYTDGGAGNTLQGPSWHRAGLRPVTFLDGHAKVLTTPAYVVGTTVLPTPWPAGGPLFKNIDYNGGVQQLFTGPYSTYGLGFGQQWPGGPPHAPYDYWIDEY